MTDGIKIHRRHGFYVLVMVVGWVLPPVAVLLRFGFGTDFFLNILLTLCGYIPGHGHNFYLQNIRNNENRKRTPQWATKAGLVKDHTAKRKAKTQWANRYDERTPTRADGYQDDDERPTASSREGGGVHRSGLLEPESYMDSSSSITRDERSLENGHQPQRHPGHFSSQEARDLDRFPTDDRRHLRKKKSTGHRHTLSNLDDPSSTSNNGYDPSGIRDPNLNSSKIVRRKTSQSIRNHHHHDDHHQHNEEDPYFIRRASSIHGHPPSSSASHSKFGPLGSPTSTKSFSQKLGFGSTKKTEKKNRFDLTNEARSQWENLPHATRHSTPHPKPLNNNDLNNDDCLNHQF